MKSALILAALILTLPLGSFGSAANAQSNVPQKKIENAEPMGENDRLAFMQTEETVASQEPSSGGLVLKTIGAMLLIVGLIFAGAWAAKKLGFGGTKTSGLDDELGLAVLSSVQMGSGRTISTVKFGDRVLLVGLTTNPFTLLAEEKPSEKIPMHNTRSVAEMLAEENETFDMEFDRATSKLGLWDENEGSV